MAFEGYDGIEPLGGHKDKGRDALHTSQNGGKNTIFAYSVREDWLDKLKEDAEKIKKYAHPCDELVFLCTAKYTATERDNAIKDIKAAYGFSLVLYGLERMRMLLNKHTGLIAQHPHIFNPAFFPNHMVRSLTNAGNCLSDTGRDAARMPKPTKGRKGSKRSKPDHKIDLAPPTAGHQKPAFWEFGGTPFQEFCRDILAEDEAVRTCNQYGIQGKTDHGVDLLAPLKDQDGIIVAQCKAKKTFSVGAVKAVSKAFFKHWASQWQTKNVKRFILMVACDLQDTDVLIELGLQKAKFAEHNIVYEWWSNSSIVTRLRTHPEIVNRYLRYWLEHICGPQVSQQFSTVAGATVVSAALTAQLEQLMSAVAKDTGVLLDQATQLWKEGKATEAENALSALQQDTTRWSALQPSVRADILTLRGKLALESADNGAAERFANDASTLGQFESVKCLLALIALVKGDATQSLDHLKECNTEAAERIRVSIMLQEGKSADALLLISKMEPASTSLADTLRLKALALLLHRNVKEALAAIDSSLSLQPTWRYSRIVSGMIRYYAALSPIEIPPVLPPWPAPVDWSSVNHNDEARQRLKESASIFDSLRQHAKDDDERECLEGWLLGALASNRSSQKEAEDECRSLLEKRSIHAPAIEWAIARKYDVIGAPTRSALAAARISDELLPDQILSLVLIHLGDEDSSGAGQLLDETRQKFMDARSENLWRFWRAQVHLVMGETEKVAEIFGGNDNVPLELVPLVKHKSQQELFLANRQLDDLHGRVLLDVCIAKAKLGDCEYIIANATKLIAEVQTEQSIRVVAHALIKADKYQECVSLLSAHAALFNGQTLPHDLQFVQAQCYQRLGLVNEALEQAERSVLVTPNTQTMLAYVTMLLQVGNMPAMLAMVRKLSRQPDLTPVQAIRLAEVIQRDDPLTAKTLWHKSMLGRLKGEYVFRAINLGYNLGLERDPAYINLHRQIQHIAQSGSKQIRTVTLDEAAAEFKRQHEANEKCAKSYRESVAPVHFIYTVPLLYHNTSATRQSTGSVMSTYHIFAFHEDRQAVSEFPDEKPSWNLNVDISALMVAHEYGFLEFVIEEVHSISIPSETISVLLAARQELQMLPNDRSAVIENILKSILEKRIHSFDDYVLHPPANPDLRTAQKVQMRAEKLIEYIRHQDGWFVDFISASGASGEEDQPTHFSQRTDASAVVSSLRTHSLISEEQFASALTLLPKTNPTLGLLEPPPGAKLYTHASMLETLSNAGVLDQTLGNFSVYISRDDYFLLQKTFDEHVAAKENYDCLKELIDHLNSYIQQGKILLLPHFKREVRPVPEASVEPLYSLLQISPQQHDALWIDDRFVNKFVQRDEGIPIVTSLEVLKGLAIGPFGKQKYYETLIKMRRANVRYIPVEADEIFFHLQQAPIQEDELIETIELKTLRSYVGGCLTDGEAVHKHQANSEPILFFERLRQGIIGAWDRVWRSNASHNHKKLWANWLYSSLFAEPRSLCLIATGVVNNTALASVIGELLFTALVMIDQGAEAADQYLKWLFKKCLKPLFQIYPGLARDVAVAIKRSVTAHFVGNSNPSHTLPIFQWWYYHMPSIIRNELTDDADSMSLLQLRNVSFGSMYGFTFVWDELERAITTALSSGAPQSINTRQVGPVEISAQILSDNRVAITLSSKERSLSFADDEAQYLFNRPHERRLALIRQSQWIDIAPDQLESVASKLAYTEPASIRIEQLQRWQEINANAYYAILNEVLRARQRLHYDRFLPQSIESLLNHNRFLDPSKFDFAEMAKRTLTEEMEKFAELIGGLPCMITDDLLLMIDKFSPDSKRKLVRALLAIRTPLSLIQLVKVLGTPSNNRAYAVLRNRILRQLLSQEILTEYQAFERILKWIGNRFAGIPDARKLPWDVRLALIWLHASKLFGTLRRTGHPANWIAETFAQGQTLTSVALLDSTSPIRGDAATPNLVKGERLLASGLFYCMSGDELIQSESRLLDLTLIRNDNNETFPKPDIFRSPPQSNVFNSFLGLDIGELAQPGSELQVLSAKNLHAMFEEGIGRIRANNQPCFWWLVLAYMIPQAGDANEFSDAIKSLISDRGLVDLSKEAGSAFAPIIVTTAHAATDDALKERLVIDLGHIAYHASRFIDGANGHTRDESEFMLYQAFIEAGIALSRKDGVFAADSFGELMIDLASRCPHFAIGLKNFIDDLWEELPAQESAALWKLRTFLEAAVL